MNHGRAGNPRVTGTARSPYSVRVLPAHPAGGSAPRTAMSTPPSPSASSSGVPWTAISEPAGAVACANASQSKAQPSAPGPAPSAATASRH